MSADNNTQSQGENGKIYKLVFKNGNMKILKKYLDKDTAIYNNIELLGAKHKLKAQLKQLEKQHLSLKSSLQHVTKTTEKRVEISSNHLIIGFENCSQIDSQNMAVRGNLQFLSRSTLDNL